MPGSHERTAPTPAEQNNRLDEPEQDLASQAENEQIEDRENRTRDAEILGRSYSVRLSIDRGVTSAIAGTHDKIAKLKNTLSTPKNAYLRVRHESAQNKHARKEDKANEAQIMAEQAHSEVGTGRIFTGKRRAERLQRKADKLQGKADTYKQTKLDKRESAYTQHSDMMKGRTDNANQLRDKHESIHTRKIEMYRDRKSLAQGNKELRKMRRELRGNGTSKAEINRTIGSISLEQRKRIGAVACLQESANRALTTANRDRVRLEARQRNNDDQLSSDREAITEKSDTRDRAAKNLNSAEEMQEAWSDEAANLQTQLDTGVDHEGTELTETGRANIAEKLEHANSSAEQAGLKVNEFLGLVNRLDAEINSLTRDIRSRERKVDTFAEQATELNETVAERNAKVVALGEERSRLVDLSIPEQGPTQETPPVQPTPRPTPQPTSTPIPDPSTPPPTGSGENES